MTVITDQPGLQALCDRLANESWITVDTEFLRDRTYYPQLCLVQLAGPNVEPAAVDPLADGIDLTPLLDLMNNPGVLKVFHAARQDLEIFYNLSGKVPAPLFDSQVAAMVCGHGDQAGYNTLVEAICKVRVDKGAQFTDWSRRPLSAKQISYALDDVHYLRQIYRVLSTELEREGRTDWVREEMAILENPQTYQSPPDQAWERIKIRTDKPQVLAVLKELAAWRETEAQRRNVPRNRVIRDEALADMAVHPPKTADDLKRIRAMPEDVARGKYAGVVLDAVKRGLDTPRGQGPAPAARDRFPQELQPVLEMLKMLLRIVASEQGVAARLIASTDDLEGLARGQVENNPAMQGWRQELFGRFALDMMQGRLALSLENGQVAKKAI